MSHHMSMSRASLALICAWSFRADAPQHPRPPGKEAIAGSLTHKMMELFVKKGELPPDHQPGDSPEMTAAKDFFSAPVRAFLESRKWTACEIGLRYDVCTDVTTLGPRRGDPGYEDIGSTVIPGTLDLVEVTKDLITVVDLKTGKLVSDREQLYVQAVAASRYYDVPTVRVGYAYARKTKCDEPKWETLTADDLDAKAGRLAKLMRVLPTSEPLPGDHCWRCSSRPSCPAYSSEQAESSMKELEEAGLWA